MKIVSFTQGAGAARVGALLDSGRVLDLALLAGAEVPHGTQEAFDLDGGFWTEVHARLANEPDESALPRHALHRRNDVRLLAPVPRPGKVICIGLNYRDHAAESKVAVPERPLIFSKFPTSIVGPDEPVRIPQDCAKLDYEAELAFVIGRRAFQVSEERAIEHVLGYTNFNDVSARDFQFADGQWQRGKSCDTLAPMGPFLATPSEVPDPHRLRIRLRVNGTTLQDSSTAQMVFGVPKLVASISETITLEPGDVIATGTPPGVGFARKPPLWLKHGDRMEVEIEGLGVLANPVFGGGSAA
jgi:2-keto-4-pentenoate hydratase/2-oxohepta-3-ene-1,7-dioic acid hydratase in catechol pathway